MKNLPIISLAAALLLGGASAARAQVSFGVRVGANIATFAQDVPKDQKQASLKPLFGGQAGVVLHARFGKLAFQPALVFSQKGYADKGDPPGPSASEMHHDTLVTVRAIVKRKGKDYLRLSYLEVPLNFIYTFGEDDHGLQFVLGPYVSMGLGGKQHTDGGTVDFETTEGVSGRTVSTETVRFTEFGANDRKVTYASKLGKGDNVFVRRLDVGFNGGVGYRLGPVQVQALYGWGLANLVPHDTDDKEQDGKLHHRVGQLTLTYLVGGK